MKVKEMKAELKYQIASYSGTVEVPCHEDDENEVVIAKVKRILVRRAGELPYGSESFRIQRRQYV